MPELLTPPIARPSVVTIDETRVLETETVIDEGVILFSNGLGLSEYESSSLNGSMAVYIDYDVYSGRDPHGLINHGVIWNYQPSTETRTGLADFGVASGWGAVTNNGVIAVENENKSVFVVFAAGHSLNSGWLYGYSAAANVHGYTSEDPFGSLTNEGVIAVHSPNAGATGVIMDNGGTFINETNGIIQAAGANATGVVFNRGAYTGAGATYDPQIVNRGLIEAISLDVDFASIGIFIQHLEFEWMEVVNEGTIRADIAIFASGASYSPQQESTDRVTNSATGVIEGAIMLAEGDDILVNHGAIRGDVLLGNGDDLFDTRGGSFEGFANGGFGNDVFLGSAFSDYVRGETGDDRLEGNGGNDLLIGDWGADTLIGGLGNDGLYGEFGDDLIVTLGGDVVLAGAGTDRVELGDYTFAFINGEDGHDTLALAGTGRLLDLSAVVASGRLLNFEQIELGASDGLVVRASDVSGLNNDNQLIVSGTNTGTLHLVGAWAADGAETVDGVSYSAFRINGERVLVAAGIAVTISASAPAGAVGLDAIATGDAAPEPGVIAGSERYSGLSFANFFVVRDDLQISESETWYSEQGNTVLAINDFSVLDNDGTIISVSDTVPSNNNGIIGYVQGDLSMLGWFDGISDRLGAMAVYSNHGGLIDNSGLIYSESTKSGISVAISVAANGPILNSGTISSFAVNGAALGIHTYDASFGPELDEPYAVDNRGELIVSSETDRAIGIFNFNGATVHNSGRIDVSGGAGAYGVVTGGGHFSIINEGEITATTTNESGDRSAAFYLWLQGANIVNSGTISADDLLVDYSDYQLNVQINNSGTINADITTYRPGDELRNSGLINGQVNLGAGNDVYYNLGGTTTGLISGGEGEDIAHYQGVFGDYTIVENVPGQFTITGAFGSETLTGFETLQFADISVLLDTGTGVAVDPATADPDTFMLNIRDFDGNDLGGASNWELIGQADANGDGSADYIFVNHQIGRFAEVGLGADGRVYFDNHSWGGDTRVVGIYIDPLVLSGEVEAGGDHDSQRRFQHDLFINNISDVLGSDDYDGDGLQEVYFALTDGTAFLHAYMHADGNIRYANYQSQQQVIDFLTANGYDQSTWADWFPSRAEESSAKDTTPVQDVEDGGKQGVEAVTYGLSVQYDPIELRYDVSNLMVETMV
ncbi:calcium-binding protein [Pontixanthobacter aquaemixtae]|uniref:Uncharacterized protein n=1 Tax=Pontixanthobacter aquaemixtae TaxID=1958940 RepID=A0A844ZV79_9SPHN|nr:calcium-binding protein [Pontixanthobacter aquaemixtae]MXO90856.1 hypothetical protein [Pontixanthobacter aquaemixtae]